jgi:hypothetical protein
MSFSRPTKNDVPGEAGFPEEIEIADRYVRDVIDEVKNYQDLYRKKRLLMKHKDKRFGGYVWLNGYGLFNAFYKKYDVETPWCWAAALERAGLPPYWTHANEFYCNWTEYLEKRIKKQGARL